MIQWLVLQEFYRFSFTEINFYIPREPNIESAIKIIIVYLAMNNVRMKSIFNSSLVPGNNE